MTSCLPSDVLCSSETCGLPDHVFNLVLVILADQEMLFFTYMFYDYNFLTEFNFILSKRLVLVFICTNDINRPMELYQY